MIASASRAALALLGLVPLLGCIHHPPIEEEVYGTTGQTNEDPHAAQESPFCTVMRPVTALLKRDLRGDIECVNTDYSETGSFGSSIDAMESSFRNACFSGLARYDSEVETHERPLGSIRSSVVVDVEVDGAGRIDLSELGVVPPVYQFQEVQGPLSVAVTMGFREPVLRSVRDLGYTLSHLGSNPATPKQVRESIQRCTRQLCGEETIYTSNIVSTLPEVLIEIKRGAAATLRPVSGDKNVVIRHSAPRSFVIQPLRRLNLAAQTSGSRDMMIGQGACGDSERVTPPAECRTITYRGIKATYHGCGRVGGKTSHKITCQFSLSSPGYDQPVELYVGGNGQAATLIDDQGVPHVATWGELANIKTERLARTVLVADVPTKLTLHYDDLPKGTKGISRLTLRMRTQTYVDIDFPDIELLDDASFASCKPEA